MNGQGRFTWCLWLAAVGGPAVAEPAGAVPPPPPPVLTLADAAPVEASRLQVRAVRHEVDFTPPAVHVVSTWTITTASLAGCGGYLLLSGPESGAVRVAKAEVDGVQVAADVYAARPWRERITLPVPAPKPAASTVVRLIYTLPLGRAQSLYRLGRNAFPRLDRLVEVNGQRGFDLRSLSPFSYADPLPTSARVAHAPGWGVVASGRVRPTAAGTDVEPVDAAQFLVLVYDRKAWSTGSFAAGGTTFTHLRPARQPAFAPDAVRSLASSIWPRLRQRFGPATKVVTIVETDDGALSGGMLGSNIAGLFARREVGFAETAFIQNILGWPRAASTRDYVGSAYRTAKDPWREYLTGMLSHELAHFWFGFGRSTERVLETYQEWLSLGLGLVYDSEVTRALTGRDAPLFEAAEQVWRDHYAANPKVDQRLEHPDVAGDPKDLARVQVYAHAKARWSLRQLRDGIGADAFDHAVKAYLEVPADDGPLGYARLRRELAKTAAGLPALETKAGIF